MAATLYRALRYIEESKIYSYTEFTSRLDKYSDCGSIAPWATEAMAFMEALGLMEGAAGSTIAPDRACTVEEASRRSARTPISSAGTRPGPGAKEAEDLIQGMPVWFRNRK